MLETVREYAREKLRESGAENAVRDRYLAYYIERASTLTETLTGLDPEPTVRFLETEVGNLRAALAWAQAQNSEAYLQLVAALWPFWEIRSYFTEGRAHLRYALNLTHSSASPTRLQALLGATNLAMSQMDVEEALDLGQECLERFQSLEDPRGMAEALLYMGQAYLSYNALERGMVLLTESLNSSRLAGWLPGTILATLHLGMTYMYRYEISQGRSFLEEGLVLAEAHGNPRLLALANHNLGVLEMREGNYARSRTLLEKAMELRSRLGDRKGIAYALGNLGEVEQHVDTERAIAYWQEERAIFGELGNLVEMAHALNRIGNLRYRQGDFEAARRAYVEALDLCRPIQDKGMTAYIRMNLGCALFHLGDSMRAKELHREALPIYVKIKSEEGIVWSLERLTVVEAAYGDAVKSARLLGAASLRREGSGFPMGSPDRKDWEEAIAAVSVVLPESHLASLREEGRNLTTEQAIALALEETESR